MRCEHYFTDTPKNREKGRVGKQCGRPAENETPYCRFHGGNSTQVIAKAQRTKIEREAKAAGFTDIWPENHRMLDPFTLLLWEIRRSAARIEWYDRKITELEDEKSIWWGLTKMEKVGAAEFTGTNKTFEARANILVKMQDEERVRLKALRDEWQSNRFEAAKVAAMGEFRAQTNIVLRGVLRALGHDPNDPAVRQAVAGVLSGLRERQTQHEALPESAR